MCERGGTREGVIVKKGKKGGSELMLRVKLDSDLVNPNLTYTIIYS